MANVMGREPIGPCAAIAKVADKLAKTRGAIDAADPTNMGLTGHRSPVIRMVPSVLTDHDR